MSSDREEWLRNPRVKKNCRACGDSGAVYVHGHDEVRGRKILYFGASKYRAEPFWIGGNGKPKIPVECRCVHGAPYTRDPALPGNESCERCRGCGWYVWPEGAPIPDDVTVLGETFEGRPRVECNCTPATPDWEVTTIDTRQDDKPKPMGNWDYKGNPI